MYSGAEGGLSRASSSATAWPGVSLSVDWPAFTPSPSENSLFCRAAFVLVQTVRSLKDVVLFLSVGGPRSYALSDRAQRPSSAPFCRFSTPEASPSVLTFNFEIG